MHAALREDGASEQKAARISTAAARTGRCAVGYKGGKAGDLETRTVPDLSKKAWDIGLQGYSRQRKDELIESLRHSSASPMHAPSTEARQVS